jgi:two-component system NarL family sensor kinase
VGISSRAYGGNLSAWRLTAVAFGAVAVVVSATILAQETIDGHPSWPAVLVGLSLLSAAIAVGAALVRANHRGPDRALTRSIVTALVLASYAGAVAILTALVDDHAGIAVALGVAGLVAFAAQPLVSLAHRRLDTRLFGDLDDPYRVLTRLARRLETTALPEDVLPGVVETVATALRLPYVAVELESQTGPVVVASTGQLNGSMTRLPLVHQAERIGYLVLGTRARGERLTTDDLRLLRDLARQIGVAARAVQLVHDLERSRAMLVMARDEERSRLQRNLHDGLGPMLAGINLAVQAARNLLTADPAEADAVLARVVTESRTATDDVRRLVYGLRPPALDRLGLVGALREQVSRLRGPGKAPDGRTVAVTVEAGNDLGELPPAVELAAYRIALEAFINIWRHAHAHTCLITLSLDDVLHVDVVDDGDGLAADFEAGVGITSMRVRAMELGGTCTVTALGGGGTRVHADLPMPVVSYPRPTTAVGGHISRWIRTEAP